MPHVVSDEVLSKAILVPVFGDFMTDVWWCVRPKGLSQDSGCPRYELGRVESLEGGAGNVAANIRILGLFPVEYRPDNFPLIKKHRLYDSASEEKQIVRWDEWDHSSPTDPRCMEGITKSVVVISDYAKGSITGELIEAAAANKNIMTFFIDTKNSPVLYEKIANRSLFFPNFAEYMRHCSEYDKYPNVLMKKGRLGIEYLHKGVKIAEAPASCPEPISTCGAGDVVLAAAAVFMINSGLYHTFNSKLVEINEMLNFMMKVTGNAIKHSRLTCRYNPTATKDSV